MSWLCGGGGLGFDGGSQLRRRAPRGSGCAPFPETPGKNKYKMGRGVNSDCDNFANPHTAMAHYAT